LHRARPGRPGARRLRHPRGDPARLSLGPPAHRRPRPPRGHPHEPDAGGRRLAAGRAPVSEKRGSGARALKQRVKTARKRTVSSQRWLERQLNDPYVALAKREGYRSRAAFKLLEIDDKYRLLKPGQRVVDLGAAPGGWAQVAVSRVGSVEGRGRVVGIDLLDIEPLPGAEFIRLDFLEPEAPALLTELLGGPADLVL